jgi:hypothetical protein
VLLATLLCSDEPLTGLADGQLTRISENSDERW